MKLIKPVISASWITYIFVLLLVTGMPIVDQAAVPAESYSGTAQTLPSVETRLASHTLSIWLARTSEEKAKGLMFAESMQNDQGMLFIYQSPRIMAFWMKNTRIPLDLIFFSDDLEINGWIEGMQPGYGVPEQNLPHHVSELPAQYALELNAGSISRLKLKLGDRLEIPLTLLHSD